MKDKNGIIVKTGDQIILIESKHGANSLAGKLVNIIGTNNCGQFRIVPSDNQSIMPYNLFNDDTFVIATKEEKLKLAKEKLEELKVNEAILEEEIEFLEKYDSQEEFVAEKIMSLMKAGSKDAMVEILKTLKQSNLL